MSDAKYHREYYHRTKHRRGKRKQELQRKRRHELAKKRFEYLEGKGCLDCGEDNPIVLDFDHREGETKIDSVANMIRLGFSWEKILIEIQKCDIRCANCHRIKTAKEEGWYQYMWV